MSAKKWSRVMAALTIAGSVLGASLLSAAPAQAEPESVVAERLTLRLASDPNQVVNVKGAGTADAVSVIQWAWSGANNELWEATATGGGYYRFAAVHSGKCLNVRGGGNVNGTSVIQYRCGDGANEQWKFVQKGAGYYVVAKSSGKCLNVRGGVGQGRELIQYNCTGVANDIWLPVWEPVR